MGEISTGSRTEEIVQTRYDLTVRQKQCNSEIRVNTGEPPLKANKVLGNDLRAAKAAHAAREQMERMQANKDNTIEKKAYCTEPSFQTEEHQAERRIATALTSTEKKKDLRTGKRKREALLAGKKKAHKSDTVPIPAKDDFLMPPTPGVQVQTKPLDLSPSKDREKETQKNRRELNTYSVVNNGEVKAEVVGEKNKVHIDIHENHTHISQSRLDQTKDKYTSHTPDIEREKKTDGQVNQILSEIKEPEPKAVTTDTRSGALEDFIDFFYTAIRNIGRGLWESFFDGSSPNTKEALLDTPSHAETEEKLDSIGKLGATSTDFKARCD